MAIPPKVSPNAGFIIAPKRPTTDGNTPSPGPTGNTPFATTTVIGDEIYDSPKPRTSVNGD